MPPVRSRRLVALRLPPGDAFIAAFERAWEAGDAVLPLDPAAPDAAVAVVVSAMRPHVVVDHEGEHLVDDPAPLHDDVALVIATSGSTGEPKGVELTSDALAASADATAAWLGQASDDRWLACLPWHHIGGLQVFLRARRAGLPLVVHPRFDVEAMSAADATLVSLVPTQLARLLDAGVDLSRFRAILLGGAAAPSPLLRRAAMAGARVVTTYGMSETSGGCVYDGEPLAGVGVRVTGPERRIELGGAVLTTGYRLRRDLTVAALRDGWLRTEDTGTVEDGRLTVVGRLDDVIVTGGENVVAGAVEAALADHPDIAAVAVAGVPDAEWGSRVVAVVVPRVGERAPSLDEVRGWVRDRIGAAAAPRAVVPVDALPLLPSGKPDRLAVRRLAATAG